MSESTSPDLPEWRGFWERTLLALGLAQLVAGIVFFFAYNWEDIGRVARLALVELALAGFFLAALRHGPRRLAGQLCLAASAALIGPLLGVYGQAYQTGADSYQLFLTWALLALPWVLAARFGPLWLGWVLVLNTALALYCDTRDWWTWRFEAALLLAALNGLAWGLGEALRGRLPWLQSPWLLRPVGLLALTQLALPACVAAAQLDGHYLAITAVWALALLVVFGYYRWVRRDLFFLAAGCANLMAVVTCFVGARLSEGLTHDVLALTLCLGFCLVIEAALAGAWFRSLLNLEENPPAGTPWYVRVLLGGAAWLAACITLIGMAFGSASFHLLVGAALCLAAVLLRRKLRSGTDFLEQFSLAIFLLGQAIALISLEDLLPDLLSWAAMSLTLQVVLVLTFQDTAGRFLTGIAAGFVLEAGLRDVSLASTWQIAILATLTATLWLGRQRWLASRWADLHAPLAYAAACNLLLLLSFDLPRRWQDYPIADALALMTVVLAALARRVPRSLVVPVTLGVLVFGGVTLARPGLLAALALLALGFQARSALLQGLAGLFLLLFGSNFYYEMSLTLLSKSLILLAAGLTLLLLRRALSGRTRIRRAPWIPAQDQPEAGGPVPVLAWVGLAAALVFPNLLVLHKESLLRTGTSVYLELTPVDPRSLMQGDYMRLSYSLTRDSFDWPGDGYLVVAPDERRVGRLVALDRGHPLEPGQLRLRFRRRGGVTRLGAESYFFQEGESGRYGQARYAELKVSPSGDCLVRGLLDRELRPL